VYVYLSKILPIFVMPLGIVFVLALVAFLLHKNKRRISAAFLAAAIVVLWVSSTPIVAHTLGHNLESHFPPVAIEDVQAGGCVIVLGGALGAPIAPRVEIDMSDAVDRVYKTAQLYKAGKAPFVIVTGGNQPWSESGVAEAELIRDLLMEWGVPKDKIYLEGSSRNTRENALYTKNIIDNTFCKSPLLVTSAAHMPRAVAAFKGVGIQVTPISTDIRVTDKKVYSVLDFIPDSKSLAQTSDAIREWVGQKVYEVQGWN
jgi:uncharacterized SAM-binding protein YcdF (DUF218 family)